MDGFKAYKYYMAIKLHFTKDSFDVFKNRGNVKGTREAFNARNDRYLFEKVARKYPKDVDIIRFFVASFAYGNDATVYSVEEAESCMHEWNRRKQSMTKIFSDDLAKVLTVVETEKLQESSLYISQDSNYPVLLKMLLGGIITIETLRIIDDLNRKKLIDNWKQDTKINLIWEDLLRRIHKLDGFVKYDQDKVRRVYNLFQQEIK
jgi:hypothetical protein